MVNKSLRPFLICCIIYIAITLLLPQKVNAEGPTITGLSSTEIKPDSILEIRGTQLGGAESLKYNVLIYRFVNGFETLFTLYDVLEKESNNQLIKIKFQNKDEFQKFPEAVGQKWKLRVIRPYDKRIAEANQELTVIGEVPKSYLIDTTISVTCGEGGNKKALPNQDVKLLASIPESVGNIARIIKSGDNPVSVVYSIPPEAIPTVTYYFSIGNISIGDKTLEATPTVKWAASLIDSKFSQENQPFEFHYPTCPTSQEPPSQQITEIPTKTITTITTIDVNSAKGIAVRRENGQLIIANDSSDNETVVITPSTAPEGEQCDTSKIQTVKFMVNKIMLDGTVISLLNDPNYPNCQPKTFTLTQLGDLSQIDNLEAVVTYTHAENSPYASSEGKVTIKVAGQGILPGARGTTVLVVPPGPDQGATQAISANQITISNYLDFRSDNAPGDIGSPTITVPQGSTVNSWTLPTLDTEPNKRVYFREITGDQYSDYIVLLGDGEKTEVAGIKLTAKLVKKTVKMTVTINGTDQEINLDDPSGINVRLEGMEGKAQVFNIPYVKEYSNGEVERSAFEIDYQPPKLCECTYPQECTTADNREGTQVCNGVWKAGLGSDCIWDESGGCDPGCNVNTCVANPSPTSTPAPTVTPDPGCPVETCTYSTSVSTSSCASGTAICKGTGCSGFNCTKGDGSGCDYQACLNTRSGPGGCECYIPSATPTPSPATPTPSPSPAGKTLTGWYCGGVNGNSIFERYSEGSIAYSCTCGSNSRDPGDCWSSDGTAATICQSKTPSWPYTEDAKCVKPAPSCTEGEIVRNECTRCRGSHQICKHADCSEYICIEDEDNTACDWFNCPPPTFQCTGEDWTKYNLGDYETKCTGSCIRDGCYPGNYTGGEQVYRQCGANGNWGGWQGQCSPDCDQYCQ